MKKRICFLLALLLGTTSCGGSSEKIQNMDITKENHVYTIGRTGIDQNNRLYFANSCSGFEVRFDALNDNASFKATVLSTIASPYTSQYIKVYIDGVYYRTIELKANQQTIEINNAFLKGEHYLKVVKLNEAAFTKIALIDVEGKNIQFKTHPGNNKKTIEFYGDSITCGYGNLEGDRTGFKTETEDGTVAYTQLTADLLSMNNSVIGYSGISLAMSPFNSTFTMMDKYTTIDGTNEWDFSKRDVDVVVINIGTNDNTKYRTLFGQDKENGLNTFFENYKTLVDDLSVKYENAKFFFAYNMMLEISNDLVLCMQGVANHINDSLVNPKVFLVEFEPDNKGVDGHPSEAGHRKHAEKLALEIQSKL